MAVAKSLIVSLFTLLLVLHDYHVEANDQEMSNINNGAAAAGSSLVPKMNCGTACGARCRLSSRQNLCKRACGTCCARCNCVPPGTSGNQETCPCYYTMTTHGGRRKCP